MPAIQSNWPVPATPPPTIRTKITPYSSGQHAPANRYRYALQPDAHGVERILRVQTQLEGMGIRFQATICGVHGLRDITWWSRADAAWVQAGCLVRVGRDSQHGQTADRVTPVAEVAHLSQVDPDVNLLNTVPRSWQPAPINAQETTWADRFHGIWGQLSGPMRAWFNALFWNHPRRLYRYLTAPASMKHHHARKHGLFIHSVDCALRALGSSQHDHLVNTEVLLVAALLHDVGKAEEYIWNERQCEWKLSDRGALMGHRLTTLEWMAAARVALPVDDSPNEKHAMAVYHAINACHAPEWVGLRLPRTPEAFYLASVDGLSGHCDLIETHALPHRSQGMYHPTFRGGPFVIKENQALNT